MGLQNLGFEGHPPAELGAFKILKGFGARSCGLDRRVALGGAGGRGILEFYSGAIGNARFSRILHRVC